MIGSGSTVRRRTWIGHLGAALLLALGLLGAQPATRAAGEGPVLVFAAASMKNALDEVAAGFRAATGLEVQASYAASSALAKQIEQGAPADMFVSADLDWMDYLQQRDLILPASRVSLLGNRLVLVAAKDSAVGSLDLAPGVDLAGPLGQSRLAIGETSSVPAGKYGKAALEHLGAWKVVEGKLAQTENVRAALLLVSRGEAALGIVYRTDAAADPGVRIVGTFPESSHPPIVYPVAMTRTGKPVAARFLDHLRSAAARAVLEKHGFAVLVPPAS